MLYNFIKVCSLLLSLLYLVASFSGLIHPAAFWPATFLALAFPILAMAIVVLILGWLLLNKTVSLWLVLVLLVGSSNLRSMVGLHTFTSFSQARDSATLRIISWNVRGFDNCSKHAEQPDGVRRQMINFIKQQQADVLLLQEFTEYNNDNIYSNIKVLRDTLDFKYVYFTIDQMLYMSYGRVDYGCAIFSKLPLEDTLRYNYSGLVLPESAPGASIQFGGKRLRLITTHLVSMNLGKGPLVRQDEAYKKFDSAFIFKSSKFTKIRHYDQLHSNQAIALKRFAAKAGMPVIISGDFNSVPASFCYRTLQRGLTDAFVAKGFGLGRTYFGLSPTLRIDYVLASPLLDVVQYQCPKKYLSDHYPLVVDLRLK